MAAKKNATTPLGELEMAVLEHLWGRGSGDTHEVHAAIGKKRKITYNTVQSTLKRLHEKELLSRTKVSHAFVYAPRLSREEYGRLELKRVVETFFDGSVEQAVAGLLQSPDVELNEDELDRLGQMIEKARKEGR